MLQGDQLFFSSASGVIGRADVSDAAFDLRSAKKWPHTQTSHAASARDALPRARTNKRSRQRRRRRVRQRRGEAPRPRRLSRVSQRVVLPVSARHSRRRSAVRRPRGARGDARWILSRARRHQETRVTLTGSAIRTQTPRRALDRPRQLGWPSPPARRLRRAQKTRGESSRQTDRLLRDERRFSARNKHARSARSSIDPARATVTASGVAVTRV
jgi:hypothetical protein